MMVLERENIVKEVDVDSRGVVEVNAKKVDDERQETVSAQLSVGHPGDRPVDRWKRSVDRPVDRPAGASNFLLFRKAVYLRLLFNSRICIFEKDLKGNLLELSCTQRGC